MAHEALALHKDLQATKEYWESDSFLQGRAHTLVIQHQMVSPKNMQEPYSYVLGSLSQ